jgi:single-stranded-DNA-specific exonuclease
MEYNWILKSQASAEEAVQVQTALGISSVLANLLAQRGITDFESAKAFFRPDLRQLHNPYLMQDMEKAVDRILKAMKLGERILIYGDYDVDGTTSVALMYDYLKDTYPHLVTYIPDRYKEGYGVSYAGIDFAHDNEITLIIALDCGVKAIPQVAYANERGIDFII